MSAMVWALRGATTIDDDTPEQVRERVVELLDELHRRNDLTPADPISVILTATPDIRSAFPAAGARVYGMHDVALLGAQELDVEGALPHCIRVLMHVHTTRARHELQHVYLHGAVTLRTDLPR